MGRPIPRAPISRKCAVAKKLPTRVTPTDYTPDYNLCSQNDKPNFLAHISKVIGRKQLCYELRISKALLDAWISGARPNPIDRTRDIMKAGAKAYGPDLPLDIGQDLVTEFGGLVSMRREEKK